MCPNCQAEQKFVVKNGSFRTNRGTRIQRYLCRSCGKFFSDRTHTVPYRMRKRQLNGPIFRMLCLGVSQRACAYALGVNRKTVARRIDRFGIHARHQNLLRLGKEQRLRRVLFDEMETFEHTKMKPLSIVVAVEKKTRRIIAAEVASMPAKGLLAARSRKKYGFRKDERPEAIRSVLRLIGSIRTPDLVIESDESPRYPKYLKEILPKVPHRAFKGRRGCIVGQGELKRGGFDPLFDLNHSCAMIRDSLKRLARRTWCTTKCPRRLQYLLDMYIYFHNCRLEDKNGLVALNPISI